MKNYAKLLEESRRQIDGLLEGLDLVALPRPVGAVRFIPGSARLAKLEQNAQLVGELRALQESAVHDWENEGGAVSLRATHGPDHLARIQELKDRVFELDRQLRVKEAAWALAEKTPEELAHSMVAPLRMRLDYQKFTGQVEKVSG